MMVLLITFDLNQPKERYSELYSILKTAPYWAHYIENTWLIATDESPQDWYSKIVSKIFDTDRLLIIEVKSNYWGWLQKEAWDWIKEHLG